MHTFNFIVTRDIQFLINYKLIVWESIAIFKSMMADAEGPTPGSSQAASSNKRNSIADRTASSNDQADVQEPSKNALKKAAKQEKLAAEKASKSAGKSTKDVGKPEAKKGSTSAPKKPTDSVLIGINANKEDDFPTWYQQVLTKGDMLDYYDVSGCYILKVGGRAEG